MQPANRAWQAVVPLVVLAVVEQGAAEPGVAKALQAGPLTVLQAEPLTVLQAGPLTVLQAEQVEQAGLMILKAERVVQEEE